MWRLKHVIWQRLAMKCSLCVSQTSSWILASGAGALCRWINTFLYRSSSSTYNSPVDQSIQGETEAKWLLAKIRQEPEESAKMRPWCLLPSADSLCVLFADASVWSLPCCVLDAARHQRARFVLLLKHLLVQSDSTALTLPTLYAARESDFQGHASQCAGP